MIEEKWLNIELDSQVLSGFLSCEQYYEYKFERHLVPLSGTSAAIGKGSLAHEGLHKFNIAKIEGKNFNECREAGMSAARRKAIEDQLDSEDATLVYRTLEEFWEFTQSSTLIPRACERTFKIVAYENEETRLRVILTGRIDLIISLVSQTGLIPLDYKTESERWFYSAMSNQFRIYAIACKTDKALVQRLGFQKTKKAEDKFKLETINFDHEVLEEFRTKTLVNAVERLIQAKSSGVYHMNPTNCIKGHFACMFSDKYNNGGICTVAPSVREQKINMYFVEGREWNPENV